MASEDVFDAFDLDTGSPPRPQTGHKKTWQELRSVVRETRKTVTRLTPNTPSSFEFRDYVDDSGNPGTRLYFLGTLDKGRDNTLLKTDLTRKQVLGQSRLDTMTDPPMMPPKSPVQPAAQHQGESTPLLAVDSVFSCQPSLSSSSAMSKEEILMRERKRLMAYGITSYDFNPDDNLFVIPSNNSLYACTDEDDTPCVPVELPTQTYGARMDPKICPCNSDLVAFIHESDIWLSVRSSGKEYRLTDAHRGCVPIEDDPYSAGVPSFVIQEEFDRYTGYWWSPRFDQLADGRRVYQILYEEVDESRVEIVSIFSPSGQDSSSESLRYPRPGGNNACSNLKLMEIVVDYHGQPGPSNPLVVFRELNLKEALITLYPWVEYLTRAGWTADGKYVYATILDRLQQRVALLLLSPDSFHSDTSSEGDITPPPNVFCIYEETSDIWINVHDCIHFFPQSSEDSITFLYASEKSGFRHLYRITSSLTCPMKQATPVPTTDFDMESDSSGSPEQDCLPPIMCSILEQNVITQGAWVVLPKELWVDAGRGLVYFMALKDTPLESHLYVTRYDTTGPISRLTTLGYSHSVHLSRDCTKFVTVFSSLDTPPECKVFVISHDTSSSTSSCSCVGTLSPPVDTFGYIPPTPFQYLSQAGHTAYGLYLRPHGLEQGQRYPTVLFVYGGPQVQMVTNSFKGQKFLRLHALAAEGYMVVLLDGRGSTNRGLHFEGVLQHKLGTVEINDQVEGLLWLTSKTNCIDLSRVAIHGWSYGGYLALMGITQRRDIFKVAIAGAPVVNWELYDTGYTERYLGLPQQNPEAYKAGNVLSYLDLMPESDTRLLLIHGLIDENVHFHHSSVLINTMVSAFKPHQLQVYPNERHGIRSHDAIEHYKTTVLKFLQDHL